jgi:hypothetical protein
MAPAQCDPGVDLGIEFEALRSPIVRISARQERAAKTILQRLKDFWSQLRHYG